MRNNQIDNHKTITKKVKNRKGEIKEIQDFILFRKGFEINFSDFNIIVGENGCGKTSLFKIIQDYFETDYRSENIKREVVIETSEEKSVYVFDGVNLNPALITERICNRYGSDAPTKIVIDWYFRNTDFSHGENRMDMWEYFFKNKEMFKDMILIFDEPEIGLSLKNSIKLFKFIEELKEQNNQIFVATHSPLYMQKQSKIFDMESRRWVNSKRYLNKIFKSFYNE